MKRTWIACMVLGLAGSVLAAAPAQGEEIGNEGCTPGYWKNHTDSWLEAPGVLIPSDRLLEHPAVGFDVSPALEGDSMLDALNYTGSGPLGHEQNLLRIAVAAWLNAAIASGARSEMNEVKDVLDAANNLGCPLS